MQPDANYILGQCLGDLHLRCKSNNNKLNTKILDVNNLPAALKSKIKELHTALTKELPRQLGVEAVEHFTDNFRKGGFVNNGLQKWQDVKRRDPSSSWYGFEYKGDKRTYYTFSRDKKTGRTRKAANQKQLNFSPSATKRAILTSKRNYH